MKNCIDGCNDVMLATDDDREGETIAWHLCQVLNLNLNLTKRIIIHEMTKNAIETAILPINIKNINMNIVRSQQTRQFIDLVVGYKISPILWKRIKGNEISAGRCQTPALRLVYDTMTMIVNSKPFENKFIYKPIGYFTSKNIAFSLDKRFESKEDVIRFLSDSISKDYKVESRETKNSTMSIKKPFTTSYLLQVASNELKIAPKEVMKSCQLLFESGYITYMRTDGTIYSETFIHDSERYIKKRYGEKYVSVIDSNKNKSMISDSSFSSSSPHEPIRPTNVQLEEIKETDILTRRELVLYKLIHKHAVQTLMLPPINKILTICISSYDNTVDMCKCDDLYSYTTEQILFDGYNVVNSKKNEPNSVFTFLQTIKVGSSVPYKKILCKQEFENEENKGKRKFTESSLIGKLEVLGIGRPSTYSSIVDVIQKKGYVKKENSKGKIVECIDYYIENTAKNAEDIIKCVTNREFGNENGRLFIQPIGRKIIELTDKHFKSIFDYEYTKRMEYDLDLISKGEICWRSVCERCLFDITKHIDELEKQTLNGQEEEEEEEKEEKEELNNNSDAKSEQEKGVDSKCIGTYNNIPIYVKYGKYGRYIDYDNKFISLDRSIYSIKEEQAIYIIKNNYERIIDGEVTIRNGKYGDYIYNKKAGKKPIFHKLDGFVKIHGVDSYKTCSNQVFSDWFYGMIDETKRKKNPKKKES